MAGPPTDASDGFGWSDGLFGSMAQTDGTVGTTHLAAEQARTDRNGALARSAPEETESALAAASGTRSLTAEVGEILLALALMAALYLVPLLLS